MGKSQWYIGSPNGVVLCVDCLEEGRIRGRAYHSYSAEPLQVDGFDQLLFGLEDFYDAINFPHPSTNGRTFQGEVRRTNRREKKEKVMSDEELLRKHGDLGTFIVRVQHRQNSSWQGKITWMDHDKTVNFRSVWEMMQLLASALDTIEGQDKEITAQTWEDA